MCLADIDVAILCVGKGTRLKPIIGDLPKVLAPIKGRPFIEHLLGYLSQFGAKSVWLIAGHGYDQTKEWWLSYRGLLDLKLWHDHSVSGKWRALKEFAESGISYSFLALNGDTLLSGDLCRVTERIGYPITSFLVNGVPSGVVLFRDKFELKHDALLSEPIEVLSGLDFLDIGTPDGYARGESWLDEHIDDYHKVAV
jgi:dTDP-glucose pyrophosphorylase